MRFGRSSVGYAAFDLLLQNSSITKRVIDSFGFSLQNSSITKRCFVILNEAKNLYYRRF